MISLKKALSCWLYHISYFVTAGLCLLRRNTRFIAILLLLLLFSGCGFYRVPEPAIDYCYLNPDKNLFAVGKVAIIELNNYSSYPQASADITVALFHALQKKQLFSLSIVWQNDPAWRSLQFDLDSSYTLEQLFAVRKTLRSEALLIGTVTGYQPYPHTSIGLRLKLIDLRDGQLLWAIEQVWDSADKITERRVKDYFRNQLRSGSEDLRERLVIVSQLEFMKFVASETAETLINKK